MILYVRDSRERRVIDTVTVAAFLFGCFVFGIMAVRTTVYGLLLIGALFCLVLYWVKPQIMVSVALFLSFAALPEGLHIGKVFGPIPVYAYHVALLLSVCYLIPVVRPTLSSFRLPAMFVLTIIFFTEVGLAADNATDRVVHEAMYMLEMVVGLLLAVLIIQADYIKGTMYAVGATMWFSAGMVIAGSFHSIQLAGRSESMADMAGAVDTNRIITTAETPAIAVLTVLVATQILGRGRALAWLAFFPPALIVTALTFARSTLLAVGVAAFVAILTDMSWPTLRRTGKFLLCGAAVLAVSLPGALFLLQHSQVGAWLGTQITGYNNRVLGGVSKDALAVDDSTLDRLREDAKLNRAIAEAPLFGHGLGYAYQMPFGNDPNWFTATLGTTYAHNFYLWWLCKTGAVGMSGFLWFALAPIVRGLRSTSDFAKVSVAVSLGLLVICNVAPLPEEPASALVLGMALGSALAFADPARARNGEQSADDAEPVELPPLPQPVEMSDAA